MSIAIQEAPVVDAAAPASHSTTLREGRDLDAVHALTVLLPSDVVTVDPEQLEAYARDRSVYDPDTLPLAVVRPRTVEQVRAVARFANDRRIPLVTRGKGTGLAGGVTPVHGGILLSLDRLNRILAVNPVDQTVRVEAGVITARINETLADSPLFYAPDPASAEISSIGGNIATNAGGFHCVKYGVTGNSLLSLKVVLADGSVIETGAGSVKNVAGLDLTSLFTGSEGTLGIVVEATLRLRPRPTQVRTVVAFFDRVADVGRAVEAVSLSGVGPSVFELLPTPGSIRTWDRYGKAAEGSKWITILQTDGSGAEGDALRLAEALRAVTANVVEATPQESDQLIVLRKSGSYPPDVWRSTADVAVPLSKVAVLLERLERIAADHGFDYSLVAHVGDGNTHSAFFAPRVPGGTYPEELNEAADELFATALELGGTLTGEHGVGLVLKDRLVKQVGERSLEVQRAIKAALDPNGILNPGKWL